MDYTTSYIRDYNDSVNCILKIIRVAMNNHQYVADYKFDDTLPSSKIYMSRSVLIHCINSLFEVSNVIDAYYSSNICFDNLKFVLKEILNNLKSCEDEELNEVVLLVSSFINLLNHN